MSHNLWYNYRGQVSADALTILRGDLSVEDVEDALDDARFRDDTYRDVTVWTERGGNAAVAIVGGDVVVIGEEDRVEESIDVFKDGGRSMGQDDEVASAVESLGDVLVYSVADDCSYRGCRKWATGLRAENRELVTAYGFVFRNEDGASDAERDVEDDLEDWIDSPVVSVDGVVVVASSPIVEGEFSLGRRGSLIYVQRPDTTPTTAPPATVVPSPTATDAPAATAVPDPTPTAEALSTAAAEALATAVPEPTAPPAVSVFAETDREALVALYNATNGENWEYSKNWLSDAPIGEWYGVVTNDDGRVTALVLNFNGLSGEIPAELGSLSNLKELGLSINNLSGEIPAELSSLSNLEYLILYRNELSGEIPAELGSLSNLEHLVLTDNRLSGEIPAELGSLSNLIRLHLSINNLSGEIPAELGSLSNLIRLHLSINNLSGEIPAELGSLSNLVYLDLDNNGLSGCVPSSLEDQLNFNASYLGDLPFCGTVFAETDREALVALYNATNGENWFRSHNWLSDAPLGEWYGVTTNDDGRVTWLSLSDNALSGEIPAELGSLSNLIWLRLDGNSLGGCVPSSLEDQLIFDASYLGELPFCGTVFAETDREALVALYNATNGENWEYSKNWLSDAPLGEWYGVTTNDDGHVIALVLSTNNLSGEIPAELGSLSHLKELWLDANELSGEIPAELGSLSNLRTLILGDNELSGETPAELGSLSNLEWLILDANDLSGCVPSSLEDQLDFGVSYLGGLPFC